MTSGSRIAIVGAGIAGLACAKVLGQEGFPVEVFDRTPDIGGVWSATRRYPGLRTQTSKHTYHYSDYPMPADYPRHPDGQQMQAYLDGYIRQFGIGANLRLNTEVVAADPVDSGWLLEIRDSGGIHRTSCDHLVIANGVYSEPAMPDYRGTEWFRGAGGQLGHSSEFTDVEWARDRAVVIVGFGSSALEIAEAVSHVAASTTVLARRLAWQLPPTLGRVRTYEGLMLSRFGEAHFGEREPGRVERFLQSAALRDSNFDVIQEMTIKKLGLRELGLVPEGRFEQITQSSPSVASEGFYQQVAAGRIQVLSGTTIAELGGAQGGPAAQLSDGRFIPADIVVCATGFQQRVPFLTPYVQRMLTDDQGNFRLHRQILPPGVPNLTFAGYHNSAVSPLNAELAAHWIADLLTGRLVMPLDGDMNAQIDERLQWLEQQTGGHHSHGTSSATSSLHALDELLADLRHRLPLRTRAAQWFRPIRPGTYRAINDRPRPVRNTEPAKHMPANR